MPSVTITLMEAGSRLLPTYAPEIGEYTEKVLQDTLGVRLMLRHQVTRVDPDTLTCKSTDKSAPQDVRVNKCFAILELFFITSPGRALRLQKLKHLGVEQPQSLVT